MTGDFFSVWNSFEGTKQIAAMVCLFVITMKNNVSSATNVADSIVKTEQTLTTGAANAGNLNNFPCYRHEAGSALFVNNLWLQFEDMMKLAENKDARGFSVMDIARQVSWYSSRKELSKYHKQQRDNMIHKHLGHQDGFASLLEANEQMKGLMIKKVKDRAADGDEPAIKYLELLDKQGDERDKNLYQHHLEEQNQLKKNMTKKRALMYKEKDTKNYESALKTLKRQQREQRNDESYGGRRLKRKRKRTKRRKGKRKKTKRKKRKTKRKKHKTRRKR